MRQVRRKTADPAARSYLLKARKEGLQLSWNRYENMQPQDGFGKLGLTCWDCLQGPCRLNPFSREEEYTICGRNKDDLVLHNLIRLVSETACSRGSWEKKQVLQLKEILLKTVEDKIKQLPEAVKLPKKKETSKQIGLGVLEVDTVNICLEAVSPAVLEAVLELAAKMEQEAQERGAKGYNVVLAGDLNPAYPAATVSNSGGVEFALLSGLVDLYAVGASGLGLGKNVTSAYHTVYRDAESEPDQEELRDWLIQAAVAYSRRDKKQILASSQREDAQLLVFDPSVVKAHLEQGTFRRIVILMGGSSVHITQDALLCEAAAVLAQEDVLCLSYGNAAATLGKYGLLAPRKEGASSRVAQALGLAEGSPVYWLGSEADIWSMLEMIGVIGADKILVLAPELATARDLQAALAFAGQGVPVFTAVRLPVDGSEAVGKAVDELIRYCEPQAFITRIKALLQ